MSAPRYRDLSAERRNRATETVRRRLRDLGQLLAQEPPVAHRVDEGSAVAAEVFLAETNTLHTAMRVGVFVASRHRRAFAKRLTRAGYDACTPAGDGTLLRLARQCGRRPVHVLFEGEDGRNAPRLHPADPAAARARRMRFRQAWRDVTEAYRHVHHASGDAYDVTESFEVHVIDG